MVARQQAPAKADDYYRSHGDEYLAQRTGASSDYVQQLRATLFAELASDTLTVLDFGCGTGGILSRLPAAKRLGVEVGEQAAAEAKTRGIDVRPSLDEIVEGSVDLAISFHALEHVDQPLDALRGILRALKPGARARLVVPCETPARKTERKWRPNRDQHLYTWTPLNFGNLAARAGFERIDARLAPMPSGSRAARTFGTKSLLGRSWSTYISLRDNSYNVILDAFAPERVSSTSG